MRTGGIAMPFLLLKKARQCVVTHSLGAWLWGRRPGVPRLLWSAASHALHQCPFLVDALSKVQIWVVHKHKSCLSAFPGKISMGFLEGLASILEDFCRRQCHPEASQQFSRSDTPFSCTLHTSAPGPSSLL